MGALDAVTGVVFWLAMLAFALMAISMNVIIGRWLALVLRTGARPSYDDFKGNPEISKQFKWVRLSMMAFVVLLLILVALRPAIGLLSVWRSTLIG